MHVNTLKIGITKTHHITPAKDEFNVRFKTVFCKKKSKVI